MQRRTGTKLILRLPEGYDNRTAIGATKDGVVIVCHPDFPPQMLIEGKLVGLQCQ